MSLIGADYTTVPATESTDKPHNLAAGKEHIAEVALPALAEAAGDHIKHFPTDFLDDYNIVYITPGLNLEDVNCFLLGEFHTSLECRKLNGALIQAVGGTSPNLFMEGKPSMIELTANEKKEFCEQLGLLNSTKMVGWDASEEIQDLLRATVDFIEEDDLIAIRKKIEEELKEIGESEAQLRLMQSYGQAGDKAASNYRDLLVMQKASYEDLCKKERILANLFTKGMTDSPARFTFPERTKAMVATLEKLRGTSSKVFFIAGEAHLHNIPLFSGPEYDLSTLYAELNYHKAAVLIPKMCKLKNLDEMILDGIKLPKGLTLSEQQVADLKARFSSLGFNDQRQIAAIIDEFIGPIVTAFVDTYISVLFDQLVLPEGLQLTEEQYSDFYSALFPLIERGEDTTSTISGFLQPIICSFLLSKPV